MSRMRSSILSSGLDASMVAVAGGPALTVTDGVAPGGMASAASWPACIDRCATFQVMIAVTIPATRTCAGVHGAGDELSTCSEASPSGRYGLSRSKNDQYRNW